MNLEDMVSISSGGWHSLSLKSDGTVWALGNNSLGQLGDGTFESKNIPVKVLDLKYVYKISPGGIHSHVLAPAFLKLDN